MIETTVESCHEDHQPQIGWRRRKFNTPGRSDMDSERGRAGKPCWRATMGIPGRPSIVDGHLPDMVERPIVPYHEQFQTAIVTGFYRWGTGQLYP
jgi:hypothetical protein